MDVHPNAAGVDVEAATIPFTSYGHQRSLEFNPGCWVAIKERSMGRGKFEFNWETEKLVRKGPFQGEPEPLQ
jgi:hypothetical protein